MPSSKKVILRSYDGETFEVEEVMVVESQLIKHVVEDVYAYDAIPIFNVTSQILSMVIEYYKKHVEATGQAGNTKDPVTDEELKSWDADFVKVDQSTLFGLTWVCAVAR